MLLLQTEGPPREIQQEGRFCLLLPDFWKGNHEQTPKNNSSCFSTGGAAKNLPQGREVQAGASSQENARPTPPLFGKETGPLAREAREAMKRKVSYHMHLPQTVQQQQIREDIALQGFALRHVLAAGEEPAFSYTVGLSAPGTQKPELVISGLHTATRVAWLLDIGFRIQGPPPLETRRRLARLQGSAPTFPPGGEVFVPGKRYLDLAEQELPTCFAEVAPAHYETHLGQAMAFHGATSFPVLQVIWPDPQGFFPWEEAFDQRWQGKQHLLCDLLALIARWRENEAATVQQDGREGTC